MTASLTPYSDPFALAADLSGLLLIDGRLQPSASGETFDVINPATGQVIATAADGGQQDVDLAVANCKAAQTQWAKTKARERGKLVAECGRRRRRGGRGRC